MFRPGQIAIKRDAFGRNPAYELVLDYEIEKPVQGGRLVSFELRGQMDGRAFDERFSLHADVAYNFLQSTGLRLRKYGVKPAQTAMADPELRADFERAYADLRERLGVVSGQPVDLERFLRERP